MIASILVDVKAREVDKTFDYNVPSYLERSEERRLGKDCASMCRSRLSAYH